MEEKERVFRRQYGREMTQARRQPGAPVMCYRLTLRERLAQFMGMTVIPSQPKFVVIWSPIVGFVALPEN